MSSMGRPPEEGVARDFHLHVRMTAADKKDIDRARGGEPRSDYVRRVLRAALRPEKGSP